MPINCIIIDDEPNALHLLEEYIQRIPTLSLKGKFFHAAECLGILKQQTADLIFTDINMPGLSGLELAESLPSNQKIIFTTAYPEHALTSFRYHVVDFLLKPLTFKRFLQAVSKAESVIKSVDRPSPAERQDVVYVKSGRQFIRVDFRDVLYIKGEKEYIGIHGKSGCILVYKRIKEVEELVPDYFTRIHNSYLVNTKYILRLESNHVYVGDVHLPLGDYYRDSFMAYVKENVI